MASKRKRRVESPPPQRTWPDVPLSLVIVLFVISRAFVFSFTPQMSDMNAYFDMAVRGIDVGQVPYRDYEIEYPPLAWWVIGAARLPGLPSPPLLTPDQFLRVQKEYATAFRTEMLICDAAAFALFVAILRRRRPTRFGWLAVGYIASSTMLVHLLLDRLDVGMLLLVLASLYCWLRSQEEERPALHWAAAYFALGLGASYKVIPGIIAPFLLLAELKSDQRMKRLLSAGAALTAGVVLPFAIQAVFSGPAALNFFKRHADRPIQIESMYASLMMVVSLFGPAIATDRSSGSLNLVGDLAEPMKVASSVCIAGLLLGLGVWALLRQKTRIDAYRMACFVVPAAVIGAKVFSPQYLIWSVPLCLLLSAEVLPDRPRTLVVLLTLIGLIVGMSTWLFPYHYFSAISRFGLVPDLSPVACTVLVLRNALYVGLVVWLGRALWRSPGAVPLATKQQTSGWKSA